MEEQAFVRCTNNGITVVMTEEDFNLREEEGYRPTYFTFTDEKYMAEQPWLTGSYELMDKLLKGHIVIRDFILVPFSNGDLYGVDTRYVREYLQKYSATIEQVIEVFGLSTFKKPRIKIEA